MVSATVGAERRDQVDNSESKPNLEEKFTRVIGEFGGKPEVAQGLIELWRKGRIAIDCLGGDCMIRISGWDFSDHRDVSRAKRKETEEILIFHSSSKTVRVETLSVIVEDDGTKKSQPPYNYSIEGIRNIILVHNDGYDDLCLSNIVRDSSGEPVAGDFPFSFEIDHSPFVPIDQ
jgi:hypothetical protein